MCLLFPTTTATVEIYIIEQGGRDFYMVCQPIIYRIVRGGKADLQSWKTCWGSRGVGGQSQRPKQKGFLHLLGLVCLYILL